MRRASHNVDFLIENDILIGFCFGHDYCAEHEWGIKHLNNLFGIDSEAFNNKIFGIDRFEIKKEPSSNNCKKYTFTTQIDFVPDGKKRRVKKDFNISGFVISADGYYLKSFSPSNSSIKFYSPKDTLWSGWSEKDIGIFSIDPKEQEYITELYEAINDLNASIWVGGTSNPFDRGGLILAITSKISDENKEKMYKSDQEAYQLKVDAESTGIKSKLDKAGKKYFALSPSRFDDEIKFWLNPYDQKTNQCGWYTVKELEQWIDDKGPIMEMRKL